MIRHILKDGSRVSSIAGMVIQSDEYQSIYRILEKIGGGTCTSAKNAKTNLQEKQSAR